MRTGKLLSQEAMAANYTQEAKMLEVVNVEAGTKTVTVKDLYVEAEEAFSKIWLVILYVLSMVALGFHLAHGFKSGFQTLGVNHPKYNPLIKILGTWVFGILIPLSFAAIPVYFLIK